MHTFIEDHGERMAQWRDTGGADDGLGATVTAAGRAGCEVDDGLRAGMASLIQGCLADDGLKAAGPSFRECPPYAAPFGGDEPASL